MKKIFMAVIAVTTSLMLVSCSSKSSAPTGNISAINKVAVVSFSVSDWGGSVKAGSVGSTSVAELIQSALADMLESTERSLNDKWETKKVSSFIHNPNYQNLGVEKVLSVFVPQVNGKEMPVFTQVSREIKKGVIDAEKAKELCSSLNVDAVVLVFSEWTAKTGGMIPMTKAVTKNVFTMWDNTGNMVFKKRVDLMGQKPLGMSGFKAVNDETINEWSLTYKRAIQKILQSV